MNRIRELRKARGMTQSDLAHMLGVRPATVAGWELNGVTPRKTIRNKLARKLGVTVAELGITKEDRS